VGLGPFPPDKVPVPPEQGLRLHEEPTPTPSVHDSAQPGEQSSIRGLRCRSHDLTTEHSHLVAEHDSSPSRQPRRTNWRDSGEGEVEEREGHGPVSSSRAIPGKSWSKYPDDILGTHKSLVTARITHPTSQGAERNLTGLNVLAERLADGLGHADPFRRCPQQQIPLQFRIETN